MIKSIVDLGTNTALLLIAEVLENGSLNILREEERIVGLGRGLADSGNISSENIQRAVKALSDFKNIITNTNVNQKHFIATEAMRRASNSLEVKPLLENALGLEMEIISAKKEGEYTFVAASRMFLDTEKIMVVDIGGGSTEFILGSGIAEKIQSIKIGSVVLYESLTKEAPLSALEFLELKEKATKIILKNSVNLPLICVDKVVGVAGTFTTAAAAILGLAIYDPKVISNFVLKKEDVISLREKLCGLSADLQETLPGISKGRGGVILGGLAIIESIFEIFNIENLIINDFALRHGYLLDHSK